MRACFPNRRAIDSSLPLIFVAAAAVAAASCGSVVEDPAGAGGNPGTSSASGPIPVSGPGTTVSTGNGTPSCDVSFNLSGFHPSSACKDCHESIYDDWKDSMHSRSLTSPVFMADSNLIYDLELKNTAAPDPQRFCVQCHSPISSAFAGAQVVLPFHAESEIPECALQEGVGCVTCHAYAALPEVGAAGLSDFLNDYDASGLTYFGPIANAAASPAHNSKKAGALGDAPETLCINCHNVFLDTNADGKVVAGEDFILQNTSFEHDQIYRKQRDETCIDCHMPRKIDGPVADGPAAPAGAPQNRERHRHGFVGADFPIDDADNDVQFGDRQTLLQAAATLKLQNAMLTGGTKVTFSVSVANVKAGHNLPTGFGFLRQMWVEARVLGAISGEELASSGVVKAPTDDLCDSNSLNDQLAGHVQGCTFQGSNKTDFQLVNFQMKLVTDVDQVIVNGVPIAVQAPGGRETSVPLLEGGAVGRTRPTDGASLAPLAPFESRTFAYSFTFPLQADGVRLEVALKFRALPPYFMRSLAQQAPALATRLTQNLGKIKPITMASVAQDL